MIKIAVAQITSTPNVEKNTAKAIDLIAEAATNNADLIAFPENFLFIGEVDQPTTLIESIPGEKSELFGQAATAQNIAVLMGSMYEKNSMFPDKPYNSSVLIDRAGKLVAIYRKIHLFDIDLKEVQFLESQKVTAGKDIVVADWEGLTVGMSICYDVRFPVMYQTMTRKGADLIFVPAAFTKPTGKAHWLALLKTRAIENQVYIAAPAQFGKHNSTRESFGHSVVFSPWGEIIDIKEKGEGIIYADIDNELIQETRKRMPIQSHLVQNVDF